MLYEKHQSLKKYHHPNVVIISVAGLTSKSAKKYEQLLAKNTKYQIATNYKVRTIIPSLPAPALVSLLTVSPLEFHAIDTFAGVNKNLKPAISGINNLFPTLFYYLQNHKTLLFSDEALIKNLVETSIIDEININKILEWNQISKIIKEKNSKLTVIYTQSLNNIGQKVGFESKKYYQAVENLFKQINQLLINLNNDGYFITIASLNGGNNTYTGGLTLNEMEIPHLFLSTKIKPQNITDIYELTDTGKTIATILNFDLAQACIGKIIPNLFLEDNNEKS